MPRLYKTLKTLPAWAASAPIAISAAAAAIPAASAATAWATTTSTGTSASARAAVAAFCPRPSFIHCDRASTKIAAVQSLDRRIALSAVGHFDKSESPQTSAELVSNQVYFADCSILAKSLP